MPQPVEIPPYTAMLFPTLEALNALGGSGTKEELDPEIVDLMGMTDTQLSIEYPPGSAQKGPKVPHRLAWARTYLKKMGLVDNSQRGVWSLEPEGKSFLDNGAESGSALLLEMDRNIRKAARVERLAKNGQQSVATETNDQVGDDPDPETYGDGDGDGDGDSSGWQEVLLTTLKTMTPDGFERLAQRLLREAGFRNVEVLGRSGDGGLDAVGVYKVSLVSFTVFAQCKRYAGSVPPSAVRDFRGAMSGRGEKGLLITTGSFTADATKEASRDGAPPVELVDGAELCNLLRTFSIGVKTVTKQIEMVEIEDDFFRSI